MGAGLPAMAVGQAISVLTVMASSLASQLPQGLVAGLDCSITEALTGLVAGLDCMITESRFCLNLYPPRRLE